ncbi:hypothetical protein [Nocardia rhizosphaerihabitans]|nr:hypothetical protein [Nocardia rhizosphaerihabitans]
MSLAGRSPRPDEPDIHVTVEFSSVRMDFVACLTAALVFICEVGARRLCTVTIDSEHCAGLPRLPTERLYLLP